MALGRFDLPQVLMGLEKLHDEFEPFVIAGITLFALRYATPRIARSQEIEQLTKGQIAPLAHLIKTYLLTDPVSFEPPVQDVYHGFVMIPVILRYVGNQFIYGVSFFGQYARSLKLFRDIPIQLNAKGISRAFDFENSFHKIYGVSISEFIDIGFTAFAAARSGRRFAGDYFTKARDLGVHLPDDNSVASVLDQIGADQFQIQEMYESFAQKDRRYAAYDFNPLIVYPLIRPWGKWANTTFEEYRLIAPLPDLLLTRMSEGIYQRMFFHYRNAFSEFFGQVFEAYVGEILSYAFPGAVIFSEQDVRRTYKDSMGKAPDWVVIEGNTALLFECKATGLSRKALAMGDQAAIDYSLNQVIDGLAQLHEFREACRSGKPGLERISKCGDYKAALITFEPFYIINSVPFREHINKALSARGISPGQWSVLAVDELEKLQPHVAAGFKMGGILEKLQTQTFGKTLEEAHTSTGRVYKDSFLYDMDVEIYKRLKVPI